MTIFAPETVFSETIIASIGKCSHTFGTKTSSIGTIDTFPTAFSRIYSTQDQAQEGLNCVVPTGQAVQTVPEGTLQRALDAIQRRATTILYVLDGYNLRFFFVLFEPPGEVCISVDIRCPLPEDQQRFWQFQNIFSPTSSYFADEYCIPVNGEPLFTAQEFRMCEALHSQIENCQVEITMR